MRAASWDIVSSGALSLFQRHAHSIAGTQSDHRLHRYPMARNESQSPFLRQGRQQQNSLHPGKPLADANTRAAAEGIVREFGPGFLRFRRPAFRIETER